MSLLDLMKGRVSPGDWVDQHLRGIREARDWEGPETAVPLRHYPPPQIEPMPLRKPLTRAVPDLIWAGHAKAPEGEFYLESMRQAWEAYGGNVEGMTPREFCTMPKAPGQPVAIPPRELWPWTAHLLREVFQPLREACGPLNIRGYRAPQYNKAVGGSRRSDHMWAVALDLRVIEPIMLTRLKLEAARLYVSRGKELKMSFGVYRANIHVGVGIRRRHWGDAATWIKKARQA